jgi:hypothetical protein
MFQLNIMEERKLGISCSVSFLYWWPGQLWFAIFVSVDKLLCCVMLENESDCMHFRRVEWSSGHLVRWIEYSSRVNGKCLPLGWFGRRILLLILPLHILIVVVVGVIWTMDLVVHSTSSYFNYCRSWFFKIYLIYYLVQNII